MTVFHDEIEIEDMEFDEENQLYHYPCPCGDKFEIRLFFEVKRNKNQIFSQS